MFAKITPFLLVAILGSCGGSKSTTKCSLPVEYVFNFEKSQYFAMPDIDFYLYLNEDWQVREPQFGRQNLNYFEAARVNDDSSGAVLLKLHPFRRTGTYISVSEQFKAQHQIDLQYSMRDSWKTSHRDSVEDWWVDYGIFEQEPERPYIIAHKLMLTDTTKNGILLELMMPCLPNQFSLDNEKCLRSVIESISLY